MKKSKLTTPIRLLLLLLCLAAAVPQLTAQTYTVAGAGINNGFLGTYWDPSDTINDMVRYGSTTYYYLSRTANVNSGNYAFKVVKNHSWDDASYPSNDYGYNVSSTGTWSIVYIFNTSGNAVSLFGPFKSLTVAGESDLVGSDWNPDNTACDMSSNDGIVYTLTQNNVNLTAGVHKFKVVANHSWDFQSWPGGDYELNINSYGNRFGWDFIYQDARNFTGWHDHEGMERIELPADMLSVKTLNLNAYYAFNSRRFSYPAAFSQSYIQRHSAGSFLLAASGMGQHAKLDWEQKMDMKMTNIGIGAGYGYNFVPSHDWLLHISGLPTFIVYSHTSMNFGDTRVPLHYHFPEVIITGRGAVVRQTGNKFYGMSMVFNFTNIGHEESLTLHNIKWRIRAFFGLRL